MENPVGTCKGEVKMEKYLSLYCDLEISKADLQQAIGDDLHNIVLPKEILRKQEEYVYERIRCGKLVS